MSGKGRSGVWAQKDVQDRLHVARTGSKPEKPWSGCRRSHVGVTLGVAGAYKMKKWEIPWYFPIFGLVFWNSFSYMIILILHTSVSNDFEIMTHKGQRKWHLEMDNRQ